MWQQNVCNIAKTCNFSHCYQVAIAFKYCYTVGLLHNMALILYMNTYYIPIVSIKNNSLPVCLEVQPKGNTFRTATP